MPNEPELGLPVGLLPLDQSSDFENSDPDCEVPEIVQEHLSAPEPQPCLAEGPTEPEWCPAETLTLPVHARYGLSACLVLAVWNRAFSLMENIIVFGATCLILQSQYLWR